MKRYAADSRKNSAMVNTDKPPTFQIHALPELLSLDFERIGIKGLIFDYGGTIDSRGEHWSDVIRRGYINAGIDISYDDFWEAYVYAERTLAKTPVILPSDNFLALMRKKITIELRRLEVTIELHSNDETVDAISSYCYSLAKTCTEESKPVLAELTDRYPIVMVSNFYGNLNAVLMDFGIRHYFSDIIESAATGIRKPDPGIFRLGLKSLSLQPCDVLVIGDSFSKDISPANGIGMHTAQLIS